MKKQTIKLAALALLLAANTKQNVNAQATVDWKNSFQFQVASDNGYAPQPHVSMYWGESAIDSVSNQWIRIGYAKDAIDVNPDVSKALINPSLDKPNIAGVDFDFMEEGSIPYSLGTPFLASYASNSAGKYLWSKKYVINGNNSAVEANAICNIGNSKGMYVAGLYTGKFKYESKQFSSIYNRSNLYVLKLNENGTIAKTLDLPLNTMPSEAHLSDIKSDKYGNLFAILNIGYIEGNGSHNINFANGTSGVVKVKSNDAVLLKFSSSLQFLFARKIEAKGNQLGLNSIHLDKYSNIIVGGIFSKGSASSNSYIDFDPSNSVSNVTTQGSDGLEDICIAKYTSIGNFVWAKAIDGGVTNNLFETAKVEVDKLGNIFVSAYTNSPIDINPDVVATNKIVSNKVYIAKYGPAGSYIWSRSHNATSDYLTNNDLEVDTDGDPILLYSELYASNKTIPHLIKYSTSNGVTKWNNPIYNANAYSGDLMYKNAQILTYKNSLFVSIELHGSFNLLYSGANNLINPNITFEMYRPAMIKYSFSGSALSPEEQAEESNSVAYKTGLEESSMNVSVYPNPATDFVTIKVESTENTTATIYNYSGVAIRTIALTETETNVNISELPVGMYFIEVIANGNKEVKKIIKQ
ncbi:MAG: T9SS type A sorting domain-containing protein [Bacteroidetes bacterium]|nr:T9SS type A sorting domain-containing protein [Bacteroidota bacterium]